MPESIEDVVKDVVSTNFDDVVIDSIDVEADRDSDGDPILRITVVFDADINTVDGTALAGLIRHLRPRLREQNEEAFPIFRFMTKKDSDGLRRAAA